MSELRAWIEANSGQVLAEARTPAQRGDTKLAAIAEEVLRNPKYGLGTWRRLVDNAPIKHDEECRYGAEGRSLVAYHMVWDWF